MIDVIFVVVVDHCGRWFIGLSAVEVVEVVGSLWVSSMGVVVMGSIFEVSKNGYLLKRQQMSSNREGGAWS
jgi:hypothetical protein